MKSQARCFSLLNWPSKNPVAVFGRVAPRNIAVTCGTGGLGSDGPNSNSQDCFKSGSSTYGLVEGSISFGG